MKLYKASVIALMTASSLALAGCGSGDEDAKESSAPSSTTSAAVAELPTVEELNAVLARATDPNLPIEERVQTVQNGEQAAELFDIMAQSKSETGADFQVVDPILPGYAPNSVLTTVSLTLPDREPQLADNVEFINEGGQWKVSQKWACIVVSSTVPPEQVPPLCHEHTDPAAPAPEGELPPPPEGEVPPPPEGELPPAPEGELPPPPEGEVPPPPAQ